MNKLLFTILFGTTLFTSAVRAELPGWYPDDYDTVGVVNSIKYNTVTIDGLTHKLSPTAKVSTVSASKADIRAIQVGLTVGANFIKINNRELVDRLWLIPDSELELLP